MTGKTSGICRVAEMTAITICIISVGLIFLRFANGLAFIPMNSGRFGPLSFFLPALIGPFVCGLVVGLTTVVLYKTRSLALPLLFSIGLVGWFLGTGGLRVRNITVDSEQHTEINPDLGFMLTMFVSAVVGAALGQFLGRLIMRECLADGPSKE